MVIYMKSVYLLLTCSTTSMSRLIRLVTSEQYTHVSVGLNPELFPLYSFARRFSYFPFPAGLVEERLERGYWERYPQTPCLLLECRVSNQAYTRILFRIRRMMRKSKKYKYSILGVLFCFFNWELSRKRRYFCSQFVGELLQKYGSTQLPKPSSLMHPVDFTRMSSVSPLYRGTVAGLLHWVRSQNMLRKG